MPQRAHRKRRKYDEFIDVITSEVGVQISDCIGSEMPEKCAAK